ncbi:MAG: TraB/GumN family protein [Bauldia sp.]|nr:TraB/GumN family protein [Bauldia sp.]
MARWIAKKLAVGLSALALSLAPALAEPQLWVVRDADSAVYLFGAIHYLPYDADWITPAVETALAGSREVWVEATDIEDDALLTGLVTEYGLADEPLSARLGSEDMALLQDAAEDLGIPFAALDLVEPWLASVTIAVTPMLNAGYDPERSVDGDVVLLAADAGLPVRGFETAEQQILLFASLPLELQLEDLRQTLAMYRDAATELDAQYAGWEAGDFTAAELALEEMRAEAPELYEILFVARNQNWAQRIVGLLKWPGDTFVAVGAGHFAGDGSILQLLEEAGLAPERVQ